MDKALRHDWTLDEARSIHDLPVPELVFRAQSIHRRFHPPGELQLCSLLSIKTGACPEDCAYCPQSAHYPTGVEKENLLEVDTVLDRAREALAQGASRFCMGAAWREVREGPDFEKVLAMIRGVRQLGMEACVTLGMLTRDQAQRLKGAGLTSYNHNLDCSRDFYDSIITTHSFDQRLDTLAHVRGAGIKVCCGGIIGMGESIDDRCAMLVELAGLPAHPESVPINALVAVEGTPLAGRPELAPVEMVRMVATARVMMPESMVRLSAGRSRLSHEAQMLCFLAGANSIFYGEKLLTTDNSGRTDDHALMAAAGIKNRGDSPLNGL